MNKNTSTENLLGANEIPVVVTKNFHPWFCDKFPDWELLESLCHSEELREAARNHFKTYFWHDWHMNNDSDTDFFLVMYRPIGIDCEWEDVRDGTWKRTDL